MINITKPKSEVNLFQQERITNMENINLLTENVETVNICRNPGSINPRISECPVEYLDNIHWDFQSGGFRKTTSRDYLYGYIDYAKAARMVNCSGLHEHFRNDAKVCIVKNHNKSAKHMKAYIGLVEALYNSTTDNYQKQCCELALDVYYNRNKRKGKEKSPTCKQTILLAIDENNGQIERGKLLDTIKAAYSLSSFRKAMKKLVSEKAITLEGSNNSRYQIIRKTDY